MNQARTKPRWEFLSLVVSVGLSIYFLTIYLPRHHVTGVVYSAVWISSTIWSVLRLRRAP